MTDRAPTRKVMLVDDSQTIRHTAGALLRREGFEVVTAPDGVEALTRVLNERPDLLLIDVMMPHLDGFKTCAILKSHPQSSHIPVVMLTSKDERMDRARARHYGADDYLVKPFDALSLRVVLDRLATNA